MSKTKTIMDRQQFVVKANDLIRRTRYDLTTQQQKIVLFAISKIRPEDTIHQEYEINLEELCNACGLELDSGGYYYKSLKEDFKKLTERHWCVMPDGKEKTISWIGDATIIPLNSTIYFTFNTNMQPYLFDLSERYTQYRLENVLVFKGKYAIRFYEIMRSYTTQKALDNRTEKSVRLSLEYLRETLMVDSYPRWADFDRFVIKKAVEEINECAEDIHIDYMPIKKGRTVTDVEFVINKAGAIQALDAHSRKKKTLDNEEWTWRG